MSKRPAFQFYPSDWRNDAGLRLCSIGARGLWMDMMCLMHDGEPYGHLTVMGRPISADQLARLAGESGAAVKRWLGELSDNEVFSTTTEGLIFSRRMVRDEEIREKRAAGGEAGKSFGKLGAAHGSKGGRPKKEIPPSDDDGRGVILPPPSSSSSSPSPEKSSVAKATGENSPKLDLDGGLVEQHAPPVSAPDFCKAVFDGGVALLARDGRSPADARALVGKMRKKLGDPELLVLLAEAQTKTEPSQWLIAAVETRNGNRTSNRRTDTDYRDPLLGEYLARNGSMGGYDHG